ncbi:putative Ig domain-containing protein [Fibrella aquatica]|uniref:putative Ig domain-containing protein n=1 Tax=Fibrella aquatica TaxID=3242487 RepID=UPI00351FC207
MRRNRLLYFMLLVSTLVLRVGEGTLWAQCSTCSFTAVTGGTYNLTGNQTLCITGNVSDLNLSTSGTSNKVCVAPGATWTIGFGINFTSSLEIDVYGTLNANGNYNVNSGMPVFNVKTGGIMNTNTIGFGNNIRINNEGTLTFTNTAQISNAGTFTLINGTTGVVSATATSLFLLGTNSYVENANLMTFSNLENAESDIRNAAGATITIGRYFFNHGNIINDGLINTICGPFGSVGCEFIVGNKGPGKIFTVTGDGCMSVVGNTTFNGPGFINGTLEITGDLTINNAVSGTNGRIIVNNGVSTITVAGSYNGTGMKFCDKNTANNQFDVVNANSPSVNVVYTVDCSANTCGTASPTTGCPGNLLSNGSLENGTFNAFTTSNPNINGTLATYGGSQSIFLSADPGGSTLADKPITGFQANTGYWVDASTNGGTGAKDANRLFVIPANTGANKCLFPNTALGFAYQTGDCYKLGFWVAQFDPAAPNSPSLTSVFNFEYEDTFGSSSPGTVANSSVVPTASSNTGTFRTVSWTLPASTNVKTTTGATYTGGSGQVVDWKTLNWQYITLDFTPAVASNRLHIYLSSTNTNNGVAIDGICATSCSTAASCTVATTATPGTCTPATNQYAVTGMISLTNNSAGGIATITDGVKSTTVTVAASATSVAYSLTGLTSGTGSHTITVSLPDCGTATATYSAPASCSVAAIPCSISATAVATCNDNGTLDNTADDYITFVLTPYNAVQASRFTITATQAGSPISLSLSDGNSPTDLSYAYPTPFRAPLGAAGNGNITLTITDVNNATCTTQVTVTDPGTCAPAACVGTTPVSVTYTYQTPFLLTDLEDVPLLLNRFDNGGGTRTLTGVTLSYKIFEATNFIFENAAATASEFEATISGNARMKLNGATIITAGFPSITTGDVSLPAGITVTAQGTYPGDGAFGATNLSTIRGMNPWLPLLLQDIFVDPRLDPRWVTNATGNPAHDDDMYVWAPQSFSATGTTSYTSTADLAQFVGSGTVPLLASTLNSLGTAGGGGNLISSQNTKAYAYATVVYTYICASCNLATTATSSTCNPATNQYSVTGTMSLSNTDGGIVTITDGAKSTTVTVPAAATSVAYSLTGLTSGTGSHTVTVTLPGCGTATATYSAPASCSIAPPALAVIVAAPVCNSLTNEYTATGTVSLTNSPAGSLTITDNGTTIGVISVTAGQTTASFSVSGISNASSHTVIATLTGGTSASVVYAAPAACTVCSTSITTTSVQNGQVGTPYSQTVTASDGTAPYSYTLLGTLPAGLSLSPDGVIAGTPTTASTSSFTVKVTDSKSCSDGQPLTITIADLPVCSLTATATPGSCNSATNAYSVTGTVTSTNAAVNNASPQTLTVSVGSISTVVTLTGNGPVSYTLAGLVSDGLAKTVSVLSSATACGTTTVTYSAPSACTVCTLSLTTTTLPKGEVDKAYSQTVVATGGTTPYSFSTAPGTLPAGLTLNPTTGVVSGTPTTSGTFPTTIVVTDAQGCVVRLPLSVFQIDPNSTPLMSIVVNAPICNSATNTYTATGMVSLTNSPAGSLTITDNGNTVAVITVTAGQPSASFSLTGISNGPATHLVSAALGTLSASTTYAEPESCTSGAPAYAIAKTVDLSRTVKGGIVTYTVSLTNTGNATGTNLVITDQLSNTAVTFIGSATASAGTFTPGANSGSWSIASLGAGQVATLRVSVQLNQEGITYNTVTAPNGTTVAVCTTVPYKVCANEAFQFNLTVMAGKASYQWSKDGQPIAGAITNTLAVTAVGEYTVSSTNSTSCTDGSCCPFIIEAYGPLPSLTAVAVAASCTNGVPVNDAKITLVGTSANAVSYNITMGSSFTAAAPLFASNQSLTTVSGGVLAANLANPASAPGDVYTIRVYTANGCFADTTVTIPPASCQCPPPVCLPVTVKRLR